MFTMPCKITRGVAIAPMFVLALIMSSGKEKGHLLNCNIRSFKFYVFGIIFLFNLFM
jgi:hypothetical protein